MLNTDGLKGAASGFNLDCWRSLVILLRKALAVSWIVAISSSVILGCSISCSGVWSEHGINLSFDKAFGQLSEF